jgi:hypothetical protein
MPIDSASAVIEHVASIVEARYPDHSHRLSRAQVRTELLDIAAAAPATDDARTAAHGILSRFPTLRRDMVSVAAVLAWVGVQGEHATAS